MTKSRKNIQMAVGRDSEPVYREKKKILNARAKLLALEPKQVETEEKYLDVIVFLLAYETYAVEMSFVREIFPLKDFTPLPCTPPFVLGIINVRGEIFSVIDIKKLFNLPDKGLGELNKVIILQTDDMEFGILADRILDTQSISLNTIQTSLPTLKGMESLYIKGITGESLIILDTEKILHDKKLIVNEEISKE